MNSSKSHANFDIYSRKLKADKIIKILSKEGAKKGSNLLEIGTGSGIITQELNNFFNVTSIDIVDERIVKNFKFQKVNDTILPFDDNSFDIIVSNQVIEHVHNQIEHLKEINRCLKNDGLCYIATPNKFALFEPHYNLIFLSWLPRPLSNYYLRLFKRKDYDVKSLTFGEITLLCKKENFEIKHLTFEVIRSSKYYGLENNALLLGIFKLLPKSFENIFVYLLPSWIFILKKIEKHI